MTAHAVAKAGMLELIFLVIELVVALFTTAWGHVTLVVLAVLVLALYLVHRRRETAGWRARKG